MDKDTYFLGQPMSDWLINLVGKSKILRFSRENDGERCTALKGRAFHGQAEGGGAVVAKPADT